MQWMSPREKPPRATARPTCSIIQRLPTFGLAASSVSPSTMMPGATYLIGWNLMVDNASAVNAAGGGVGGIGPFGLNACVGRERPFAFAISSAALCSIVFCTSLTPDGKHQFDLFIFPWRLAADELGNNVLQLLLAQFAQA